METALHVITLSLTILTAFLMLADFLVGSAGDRMIKEHLANWWVYIEEGDWSRLTASAALVTDAFFNSILGSKLLSWRAVITWIGVCAGYAVIFYSVDAIFDKTTNTFPLQLVLSMSVIFFVVDFAALACTRPLLRGLASATSPRIVRAFIFRTIMLWYLSVGGFLALVTLLFFFLPPPDVAFSRANADLLRGPGRNPLVIAVVMTALVLVLPLLALGWPLVFAVAGNSLQTKVIALIEIVLLSAPSTLVCFALISGSWLLYISRPVTRTPLAVIVERLAEAQKVPAAITGALAILSAIVSQVQPLLEPHAK